MRQDIGSMSQSQQQIINDEMLAMQIQIEEHRNKELIEEKEKQEDNLEEQINTISRRLNGKDKLNNHSMKEDDKISQAIDLPTIILPKEKESKKALLSYTSGLKLSRLQKQVNEEYALTLSSVLPEVYISSRVYTESMLKVPQEVTLRIVQHLSTQDRIQLSRVSKKFSKAGIFNKYFMQEQRYAAELKRLVYDYSLTPSPEIGINLVKIFKGLGDLYVEIGRISNNPEDYTNAAVFYQYVLSMVERIREEQKDETNQELENYKAQALEQLDIIWREIAKLVCILKKEETSNQAKLVEQESRNNRYFLKQLREEAEQKIKEIDEVSLKKEETESVYESEEYFINETRQLFEYIAKEIKEFIARKFKECEEVIGKPPCGYSVIGLGSLALKQFTPYSDLEFAILTENESYKHSHDHKILNYFKNLSNLVHFKIICLGETIIPTSKYNINLESLVCRGFNFDLGGKTPLGRIEKDKDYELIQTPEKMAGYLDEKYANEDKNLPYILEISCLIYGEEELFANFKEKATNFLNIENADKVPNYKLRTLKRLKEGVEEHKWNKFLNQIEISKIKSDIDAFRPNLAASENQGKLFDAKQEVYRLPDRLLYSLARYFGLEPESAWDAVKQLNHRKIIGATEVSKKAHHNLKYIASFAMMLRLRTYLANKGQFETVSISQAGKSKNFTLPERELTETGGLFRYYYTALPLHEALEEFCKLQNSFNDYEKNTFFSNLIFQNNSFKNKALIYLRLLQYEQAIIEFKKALEEEPQNPKLHGIIGGIFYIQGKYKEALKHMYIALNILSTMHDENELVNVAMSHHNIANVLYQQGEYKKALKDCEQALTSFKKIYGEEHPDVAAVYNSMGLICKAQSKYKKAFKFLNRSLLIRKRVYSHEYQEHPDIADSYNNLGSVLHIQGEYKKAYEHFSQALIIKEKVYGYEHPAVASVYNNMGNLLDSQKKYGEALEYLEKALVIKRRVYGDENPVVAFSINNIAEVFRKQGNYEKALKYYNKAIIILKKVYGEEHANVAACYINVGEVFRVQGKHEEALEHYNRALNIFKKADSQHDKGNAIVGIIYNNIGLVLAAKEMYKDALEYLNKALVIREKIFGQKHLSTAESYSNIGQVLRLQEKYDEALKYLEKAFNIRNELRHSSLLREQLLLRNCVIEFANKEILMGNLYNGRSRYLSIGIIPDNLAQLIHTIAKQFWDNGDLDLAISCYEVLSEKLLPQVKDIKHNLACCYHVKAINFKEKGNFEQFKLYFYKAKELFETILEFKSLPGRVSSCIEYAMLLINNHTHGNKEEYIKIQQLLCEATRIQDDGSRLLPQITKRTKIEALQDIFNRKDAIIVKLYILAYYLLIKMYKDHGETEKANEELKAFATKVMDIKQQEAEIPLNLLISSYEELGFKFQAKIYKEILVRTIGTRQETMEK
ncbi:tetratricopeptide repeat protein [Holosporaceae bacterium 'Namur']|nr:tetratricopeptide repeat protein [Holosporaceae bacterium 'Namur']